MCTCQSRELLISNRSRCAKCATIQQSSQPLPRSLIHTGTRFQFHPHYIATNPQMPPLELLAHEGRRLQSSLVACRYNRLSKQEVKVHPLTGSGVTQSRLFHYGLWMHTCCLVLENHLCSPRQSICKDRNTERESLAGSRQPQELCRKADAAADLTQVATPLTTNVSASLGNKKKKKKSITTRHQNPSWIQNLIPASGKGSCRCI